MGEISLETRIAKNVVRVMTEHPFYGTLIAFLERIPREGIGTAATDGEAIFYEPSWMASLDDAEMRFVLVHEVMHCALDHATRMGTKDPETWNKACDYAINLDLQGATGLKFPKIGLLDKKYAGMSAEQIYGILQKQGKGKAPSPNGTPSNDPGGCGGVIPAPQGKADEIAHEWQKNIATAGAVSRKAGKVPASIERLIGSVSKARIDWRTELRRFMDNSFQSDFSWTHPDRRFSHMGIILPDLHADQSDMKHLVLCVDTSGSMDVELLQKVMAEITAAMDDGIAERASVVYCDSSVGRVDEYERGDTLVPHPIGGGGTSFRPAFNWVQRHANDASCVIYFTDMDASDFGTAPACPVLWAGYGSPAELEANRNSAGFGELLRVDA